MQSENDWITQEDAAERNYAFYMRMDPEQREFLGPILTEYDPVFQREVKYRMARAGVVRGQKAENMQDYKVFLEPFPHARMEHARELQGWYSGKRDGDDWRQRDRPCMTDAILTQPYTGTCPVMCPFCYINASHRGYRATGLTMVPMGYGQFVQKSLSKMQVAQAGYFSSFTDPFMPLEATYHNTQAGAQAFVDAGLPIFFLSRLEYPDWAYDLMRRNPHSYMQKSINTPREDDWRLLSPRGLPLAQHFEEIRRARSEGIYVSIQCNPVVPGIVDHSDIERLIELLAAAGAHHVIVKFVEANHPWVEGMRARFREKFGANRTAYFDELFVEKQAGAQTTITEEYRREGHTRYRRKATECGMTYSLCYEYTRRDGRWVSMGPEFLTADQCHGHRVPFYSRRVGTELHFDPLEVCPPSGCLTCADGNPSGAGACGSKLLGEARALRMSDLRRDPGFTSSPAGQTIPPTLDAG
jgi:DNA repair photolyase